MRKHPQSFPGVTTVRLGNNDSRDVGIVQPDAYLFFFTLISALSGLATFGKRRIAITGVYRFSYRYGRGDYAKELCERNARNKTLFNLVIIKEDTDGESDGRNKTGWMERWEGGRFPARVVDRFRGRGYNHDHGHVHVPAHGFAA